MNECVSCATPLPDAARFCFECGSPQLSGCGACGAQLSANAKFCMSCGAAQSSSPEGGGQPTASARRVTSVLFGDLVGFTTLAESRDHEDVREILSDYFEECRTIIDRYGGTVEKFIGDAVMAVWGTPVAHEDDAERAVRAGLDLVEAVSVLGERLGVPDLAMRVGIVTGEVAVTVGARGQGMVAGDPVNTAARVQSAAAPGQVWVDETTMLLTQVAIRFADAGTHELKGKEVPARLWQALTVVGTVGGQRAERLEVAMVGRERELRLVKDLLHDTEVTRSPSLLLVSGGPGLGKTRLGWEFSKYTDGLSDTVRWLEARCPAYSQAPFHALAETFRARLRVLDDTGDRPMEELLDRFLEQWVAEAAERPWLRARVGTLLGLSGAQRYPREELFGAWLTVLEKMAAGAEVMVLLIDDAQYADDGLLDFIEFTLSTKDLPLLTVLLTRPELLSERSGWLTNPQVVTAHLRELSDVEMTSIITSIVHGLPDDTTRALVDRAAGVPLFAIETIGSLIDEGLIAEQDDTTVHVLEGKQLDISALSAPLSLQSLVASRLDLLPSGLRTIVDVASVLGASFTTDLLGDLADTDAVEDRLSELVQRQVLRLDANPLSATYGGYSFTQDVARQVAYSMLARRHRKRLHVMVADRLGERRADADLPVIASHLAAALDSVPGADDASELRDRAVAAFEAAGDVAMRLGAWSDADAHYQHAIDLTDDPLRQAALLARLAEVHMVGTDRDRGIACGREALRLAADAGDELLEAAAAGIVGSLLAGTGQLDDAAELVEPYWDAFKDRMDADDTLRWLARFRGIQIAARIADSRQSQWVEVMLALAQRTRKPQDLTRGLLALVNNYTHMGLFDVARLIVAVALRVTREHDLRSEESLVLGVLSLVESYEDTRASTATTRASLDLARELHRHFDIHVQVVNLSIGLFELGQWSERDELLAAERDDLDDVLGSLVDADSVLVHIARDHEPSPINLHEIQDPETMLAVDLANAAVRVAQGQRHGLGATVLDILRAARQGMNTMVELIDGALYTMRTRHDLAAVLCDLGEHDEAAALRIQVSEFYESLGATAWLRDLHQTTGVRA